MTAAEYLSPTEVGQLLAISRDSVLRAVKRGDLDAVVYGRLVRIPRKGLDAFLAAHRTQPRRAARVFVPPPERTNAAPARAASCGANPPIVQRSEPTP